MRPRHNPEPAGAGTHSREVQAPPATRSGIQQSTDVKKGAAAPF